MIRQYLSSLLLPKKALDALLDSMADATYDDMGGHSRGTEPETSEFKGTELNSTHQVPVIIPAKDLAQAPDPASAEFFKEGEPEKEAHDFGNYSAEPVEEEMQEHEFFKQAPEFEMSASGIRRVGGPTNDHSPEWTRIQDILASKGYNWLGRVSNGTEMWGKGKEQLVYDPATKIWEHRVGGKADLIGAVEELDSKLTKTAAVKICVACDCGDCIEHNGLPLVKAKENPKCPHCGSGKYELMPTDFETAKCSDCGKNWEHGIVDGINNPYGKTAKLQAGGKGVDRNGEYDVVAIKGNEITFRYSDGTTQTGDLSIKQRINDGVEAEKARANAPKKVPGYLQEDEILWTPEMTWFLGYLAGPGRVKIFAEAPPKYEEAVVNKYHDLTGQILDPAPGKFNIAPETKWSPEMTVMYKPTEQVPDEIARSEQKPGLVNRNQFAWALIGQGFRIGEKPNVEVIRSKVPEGLRDYFDMGADVQPQQPVQASYKVAGESFDKPEDAIRRAAKLDWDFNRMMGSGKISIETPTGKKIAVTPGMIRSVVSGDPVEFDKESGSLVSYGMNQPLGGTDNSTGGTDDVAEDEDLNDQMQMTSALAKVASMTDVSWWAKSARPTDQKIQLLIKQLGLTPEQIELCIQADPSPQQKDFVATIAKWLAKNLIKLPEDTQKIKEQLDIFNKLKKSPKFEGNKDIQGYDPETLFQTIEQNQQNVSKKEKTRSDVAKGASIIVQEGDLVIYRVTDTKALMQLSGGTNWCTAHANHSNRYLKTGPSYVFFKGGSAFAQLHPSSDQLMNRRDVCMVQEIEDDGKTIAKFVDDPTALRGLQLLAKQAPDVEAWVKENATDPALLVEILGKKKEEEAEKGTSSRNMAVQWALAKGERLDPQEEAMLAKRVPLNMLMRYGVKFHAGQPWKPLETAILAGKEGGSSIADYALKFLKGRWAAGEKKLLPNKSGYYMSSGPMMRLVDYAARVIQGRWSELEKKFHTAESSKENAWGSAHYAIEVLKQPWRKMTDIPPDTDGTWHEEEIIENASSRDWNLYSKTFFPNTMWDQFKEKVAETAGLFDTDFRPDHDLWVVREWPTVKACVRQIGAGDVDEALDAALNEASGTGRSADIPDEEEMVREVINHISYAAMKKIGASLQSELPTEIARWQQQQGIAQVDFTDQRQLGALLLYFARYAPECSVWQNMRKAFEANGEQRYEEQLASDLEYELREGMYERGEDVYTELRYGQDFIKSWNGDWNQGPCYEVLDREGAVRMLRDDVEKDISDGQLELWLDADSSRQNLQDNENNDEEAYDLMDRWYTQGVPQQEDPNQLRLQFQSSLLKHKKALVQMHETPTMLPPRDDIKRHIDEEEQLAITDDVRDGVSPNTMKPRVDMIDPRINPSGRAASKTADVTEQDLADDEKAEYMLDQARDAENEAKRHFMEEDYIKQLCDDYIPPKTMRQMWDIMGEEYTAEFYGFPYKRESDFTDQPEEGWEGTRLSSCPICKSANVREVNEGVKTTSVFAECLNCSGFYSLLSQ